PNPDVNRDRPPQKQNPVPRPPGPADSRSGLDRQAGHARRAGTCVHGPGTQPQPRAQVRIGGCIVIRFAWLQFRMQAALTAAALTIVAVVLALTGLELAHLYDTTVALAAQHHNGSPATTTFPPADSPLQVFSDFLLLAVPLLIGMFWGAPLVSREFEAGTFRLAWTQGVTRTRWVAVKLGLGAVASAAIAGLLSLMVSWWSSQLDQVNAN